MTVFEFIETLLFALSAFTFVYHLFYSIMGGMLKRSDKYNDSRTKHRFAVIIPAYKDDEYIQKAVFSILKQEYPIDCYDIYVVSEQMSEQTNSFLSEQPITLMQANFHGKGTKMKAVKAAIKHLPEGLYDMVLIMNADNTVEPNFLEMMNDAYSSGSNAIQAHRIRLERSNNSSMLNAISDEINNCIYRSGHVNLGLSSSLNGSGMAFDFDWIKGIIDQVNDNDDEKAFEALLLRDRIYVDYLDKAIVYATRKENRRKFYTQRRNWIIAHYHSLFTNLHRLPGAILSGNFDYADRILNWITFPRTLLLIVIAVMGCVSSWSYWLDGIKWWMLVLVLLLAMAFAIPDYLVDNKFNKAIKSIPIMGIGMILNFLNLNKKKEAIA